MTFNIICASHNEQILNKNLAASLFYRNTKINNKKIVFGQSNIPFAYNLANKFFDGTGYNMYVHHDVFMPDGFRSELVKAIIELNEIDNNWGVIGVAGATIENDKRIFYENLNDRGNESVVYGLPKEVQTLDELLLITKGDFEFDPQFDLHFYGADICMESIKKGRKNYVINAFVHHNSGLPLGYRSESFKECEGRFKEKWAADYGPIATTCVLIYNDKP